MRALYLVVLVACAGKPDECADVKTKLEPVLAKQFDRVPSEVASKLEGFCRGDDSTSRSFVACVRAADVDDHLAICLAPLLKASGHGSRDPQLREHLERFEDLKGPRKSDVERRLEQIEAEQKRPPAE
jgi:hypothetical protein